MSREMRFRNAALKAAALRLNLSGKLAALGRG
jgi:hypothetical protein